MALTTIPASLSATALTLTTAAQPNVTSLGTLSGLAVDGTVTADGLTVESGAGNIGIVTKSTDQFAFIGFEDNTSSTSSVYVGADGNDFIARANSVTRFRAASNGDISFYEDTGSSPKLFWDASAESLGIGTATPTENLHVYSSSSNADVKIEAASVGDDARLYIRRNNSSGRAFINYSDAGGATWYTGLLRNTSNVFGIGQGDDFGTNTRFCIDNSGNAGIGTTSPSRLVHLLGTSNPALRLDNGTNSVDIGIATSAGALLNGSATNDLVIARNGAYNIKFGTNGSTRATIDSSGNVGIGINAPATPLHVRNVGNPSGGNRNTVETVLTLDSTGYYPYNGYGVGIDFKGEDYGNTAIREYAKIQAVMTDSLSQNSSGDPSFKSALTFWTNSGGASGTLATERMRIDANGRVRASDNNGTLPTVDRHGFETASGSAWIMTLRHRGSGSDPHGLYINYSASSPDNTGSWFHYCVDGSGVLRFGVKSDGDIFTHDAAINSDRNLKTNIVDATPKLADVMKLKVRNFEWKKEHHPGKEGKKMIGLIAQEVEEIFPALVTEMDIKDKGTAGENPDHVPEMRKAITATALNAILIKAVQELTARVEELENN